MRASAIRRREYPEGDSDSDDYRRPPDRGGCPGGGPLEEDILMKVGDPGRGGSPDRGGGPMDPVEDKDHQALKDLLGP